MKTLSLSLLVTAGLLFASAPSLRADFIATATLTPGADGATNSHGSGTATLHYSTSMNDFTYTLAWMNLTGPATMAHIHFGGPGVNGPILIPFFMSNMPASDTISGTLTQADLTPANGINTIADVAALIERGGAYVNVHTAQYPAGEIRGQLGVSSSPVPEPASLGLLAAGLLAAAIVALRKSKTAVVR